MLRELELLPVWQLRVPVKAMPAPLAEEEKVVSASAEVISAELPVRSVALKSVDVSEPRIEQEQDKTEVSFLRNEHIEHMDWQTFQQCVGDCQACDLAQTRKQTVFGVGDVHADWMFIGEAPGAEEDAQGEPFVGQAGKLLDNMLAAMRLKRGDNVYIANVLKCHPPENREPHHAEIAQCELYLKRQITLIQPKLIVALGKVAAQTLLKSADTVGSMRGQLQAYGDVPVIVTYHPAYLLRNPADKAKAWEDLCFAKDTIQNL